MSTVDLMLLGVLMEKPMSAYELKKEMERRNIKNWIKISSPSVYKNMVKLYKNGYVNGKTKREGEMPEKMVYSINDKGRKYFITLMQKYSENPGNVYIDFAAFIANLRYVDREMAFKMIDELTGALRVKVETVEKILKEGDTFIARSIIELYFQMYKLFYEWSGKFKKDFLQK